MKVILGIDVSSDHLDSCILCDGKSRYKQFQNDTDGCKDLLTWANRHKVDTGVVEATGGYEKKISLLMLSKGIDSYVVNPLQVRNFAKGYGNKAKTDKIDAEMIARFASVVPLQKTAQVSMTQYKIKQLVTRRFELKKMIVAEKGRTKLADDIILQSINDSIAFMENQIKELDKQLDLLSRKEKDVSDKVQVLCMQKGIAKVTAITLIGLLPEIGLIDNKKIAALAGLAPYARDSGKLKGKRFISGGRENARKALYMPAWVACMHDPKIKAFYERLKERGKKPKVAIVAVMRKLLIIANSRVRNYIKNEKIY